MTRCDSVICKDAQGGENLWRDGTMVKRFLKAWWLAGPQTQTPDKVMSHVIRKGNLSRTEPSGDCYSGSHSGDGDAVLDESWEDMKRRLWDTGVRLMMYQWTPDENWKVIKLRMEEGWVSGGGTTWSASPAELVAEFGGRARDTATPPHCDGVTVETESQCGGDPVWQLIVDRLVKSLEGGEGWGLAPGGVTLRHEGGIEVFVGGAVNFYGDVLGEEHRSIRHATAARGANDYPDGGYLWDTATCDRIEAACVALRRRLTQAERVIEVGRMLTEIGM